MICRSVTKFSTGDDKEKHMIRRIDNELLMIYAHGKVRTIEKVKNSGEGQNFGQ